MGTWELGLTPMEFSLHGLHSVKIYEGHSQSGSRLLCQRMRVVPLQSRALCIEVWCAHGFCHSPQQVRRGLLSPSLGGEVETFRMVARLEHTGRKERMAVRECPLCYSRTCQQTEKIRKSKITRMPLLWPKVTTDATGRMNTLNQL